MIDARYSRKPEALAALAVLTLAAAASAQAPAAPVLAYPSDKAINITVFATLKWRALAGATAFHVQVDTADGFAAPLIQDSAVADTSLKMARLSDSTRYWWRVRAANASGFGAWSKIRSFTTNPVLAAGPALVSPEYFAEGVPRSPTLVWRSHPGAKGYTLQLSQQNNFSVLDFTKADIADTSFTVPALDPDVTYYWHVRANTTPVYTAWTKGAFTTAASTALRAGSRRAPVAAGRKAGWEAGAWRADGRERTRRQGLPQDQPR